MRGVFFSLLTFFFPKFCITCGTHDFFSERMGLCKPCCKLGFKSQSFLNTPDKIPIPQDRFVFYDEAFCLRRRDPFTKKVFLSLKFQNEKQISRYLSLGCKRLFSLWKLDPPDCLVLVPSSAKAGPKPYHAAWSLRERLLKGSKLREDTYLRKISKDKQSEKGYESRFFHAKKAFEFRKSDRIIRGLHVLLVDDIFTTGASLNEIARILKLRGVRKITCVVLLLSGVIESNGCSSQG